MGKYLILSSDCHAGPPAEKYREYVDPEYRSAYDDFLHQADAQREMLRKASNDSGKDFREQWTEETGDGGIRAAWDPATRDVELDKDGVAGEVIFPDADVLGLGGVTSSPFGSGLGSSGQND